VAASSTNDYQYVLPLSSVQQLPNYPSFWAVLSLASKRENWTIQ
jgi:hypothetical protein